jgi:uncharacterized protein involved in outer membrane biogenesis
MTPVKGIAMKWAKYLGFGIAVLLALLLLLPFAISLDDYRPRIEQELGARLKQPVTISRLRAFVLPSPHITADGIVIGIASDVKVTKLMIAPELIPLLSGDTVIRHVELTGVQITQDGFSKLAAIGNAGTKTSSPSAVRIRRITIADATARFDNNSVGPFDAVIMFTVQGGVQQITVVNRDHKFRADVKPEANRYAIDVAARAWRLPLNPPLVFDELKMTGVATLNDIHVPRIEARLYGGMVSGTATLSWLKGAQLRGAFEVSQLDIAALAALFSQRSALAGRLTAKPAVSAYAAAMGQLGATLRVETPFRVDNGVLRGVDIKKAATNLLMKDSSGETRFDQLSGHLIAERGVKRFSNLKIVAGALSADGHVTVAANKSLSGRVNAQVSAASVATAAIPLNVSGTVDSPLLLPTGAALAGAAVGTAILGPALGTSVGAKVGNWMEGVFGGKK